MPSPNLVAAAASTRTPKDVSLSRIKTSIRVARGTQRLVAIVRISDLELLLGAGAAAVTA
jgi:hypothetical protein